MIRSPGAAPSSADWIVCPPARTVGCLPPIVTVTVSTDWLPLAAVITSSPHCAAEPPYTACCCTVQSGTPAGTVPVIEVLVQFTPVSGWGTPSVPTSATHDCPAVHCVPADGKPKP